VGAAAGVCNAAGNQRPLLQNEYPVAENRILRAHVPSRYVQVGTGVRTDNALNRTARCVVYALGELGRGELGPEASRFSASVRRDVSR